MTSPQPPNPPPKPAPAPPKQPPDYLARLLEDIPNEQKRMRKQLGTPELEPQQLLNEVTGTVMSIQRDQAFHTKELRDFVVAEVISLRQALMALDTAYGEVDERVSSLEEQGGGGGLTDEEVTKLTMLVDGTLVLLDNMMQLVQQAGGPQNPEMIQMLQGHRQLAMECQQILAGFEPDEEEEPEEPEEDEGG
jgi:hypothetical protein